MSWTDLTRDYLHTLGTIPGVLQLSISIYMVGRYDSVMVRLHLYDLDGSRWLHDCNITISVRGDWISSLIYRN